jgi:chromosome segregation ATPase
VSDETTRILLQVIIPLLIGGLGGIGTKLLDNYFSSRDKAEDRELQSDESLRKAEASLRAELRQERSELAARVAKIEEDNRSLLVENSKLQASLNLLEKQVQFITQERDQLRRRVGRLERLLREKGIDPPAPDDEHG